MKLERPSCDELEEFFGADLAAAGLRLHDICFHAGVVSRLFLKIIQVNGLTLGRRVLIQAVIDTDGRKSIPAALAVHEICHVLQYERSGFTAFLKNYLRGYWRRLKRQRKWDATGRLIAYLSIPEEIEAQTAENTYIQWRLNRGQDHFPNRPLALVRNRELRELVVATD
jgi:hypothetical protein